MPKFWCFRSLSSQKQKQQIIIGIIIPILGVGIAIFQFFRLEYENIFRKNKAGKLVISEIYWLEEYHNCPKIKKYNFQFRLANCDDFLAGEIIRVTGRIDSSSASNIFEKKELIVQDISTHQVDLFSVSDLKAVFSGKLLLIQHALKTNFYNILSKIINSKNAELLARMLWGEDNYALQSAYNSSFQEFEDNLRLSGLSHVISISGFHLNFIFSLFSSLVLRFWRGGKSGLSRLAKTSFILLFLGIYTLTVGSTASVLRAYYMLSFFLINQKFFHRLTSRIFILISVAFLMLSYNPFYLGEVGWSLSILATAAILVKPKPNLGNKPKIMQWLTDNFLTGLFVQLFIFPLLWYYFQEIQITSFLSNLVVLPFIPALLLTGISFWPFGLIEEKHWFISLIFYIYGYFFALLNNFLLQIVDFLSTLDFLILSPVWNYPFYFLLVYYLILFTIIFIFHRKCLKTKEQNY